MRWLEHGQHCSIQHDNDSVSVFQWGEREEGIALSGSGGWWVIRPLRTHTHTFLNLRYITGTSQRCLELKGNHAIAALHTSALMYSVWNKPLSGSLIVYINVTCSSWEWTSCYFSVNEEIGHFWGGTRGSLGTVDETLFQLYLFFMQMKDRMVSITWFWKLLNVIINSKNWGGSVSGHVESKVNMLDHWNKQTLQ